MTSLFNVKQIVINGNEINRVAKHYNKNMVSGSKTTTAVTIQALEEAIIANKVDCDFEYNKKHETNISFDEYIVNAVTANTALDNTYNILIQTNNSAFTYSATSLENAEHESIYIASTAKEFDTSTKYTLQPTLEKYAGGASSGIVTYSEPNPNCVLMIPEYFYTEGTGLESGDFACYFKDYELTTALTTDDCETVSGNGYIFYVPKGIIYADVSKSTIHSIKVRNIHYNEAGNKWYLDYTGATATKSLYKITKPIAFTTLPETVSEVIISDNTSNIGINLTQANTQNLVIRAKSVNLTDGSIGVANAKLYLTGTFSECFLSSYAAAKFKLGATGELHITGNFFNNTDLDTVAAKTFGDFATSANLELSKIVVERDDLNTTSTDDNTLATRIQTILNTTVTVEFE